MFKTQERWTITKEKGSNYKMEAFAKKLRRGHEIRVELSLCPYYLPGKGTSKKKVKRFSLWADDHFSRTMEEVTLEDFMKNHHNVSLPKLKIEFITDDSKAKTK